MFVTIYCKVVFTDKTTTFIVSSETKISALIHIIKNYALEKFQLTHVEVVEAGQDVRPAELANALIPEDVTIFQKYCNTDINSTSNREIETLAFYIRPVVYGNVCVICQDIDNIAINAYYNCNHLLCNECIVECVRHNLLRCSICRSIRNSMISNSNIIINSSGNNMICVSTLVNNANTVV